MAIVIPPGFAQVAYRFQLAGDPEEMNVTVGAAVGGFGGDFQTAANLYRDAFPAGFSAAEMLVGWTYTGVRVRFGSDGGEGVVVEAAASVVGTSPGPGLPPNCAYLVRKITARPGRMGRGRLYLPPFPAPETEVDALGQLDVGAQGVMQGNINVWLLANHPNPVLLHDSASPGSKTPDVISAFTLDRRIATQRRRLRP